MSATLTKAAQKRAEVAEAIARLRELLKPGDTVWTVLRNVSRSGASRQIDCFVIKDSDPYDITYLVAKVLGYSRADNGALKVSGGGMDMGFHVVYGLARHLWPDGFPCTGPGDYQHGCPSNDHINDRTSPYGVGVVHGESGYALRQRWL